jgi:hypothetical protein
MDSDFPSPVHLVAAHLAVVVAVIHLTLGLLNWIRWINAGFLVPRDIRWPLFVFSGVALFVGLLLAAQGRHLRPLYLGGIALMVGYVVGYFGWHLGGHRSLLAFGESAGQHREPLSRVLLDHLFAGVPEFLAITSEVALAVLLAYLLVRES